MLTFGVIALRIANNLRQIAVLQAEKARIANNWFAVGMVKTQRIVNDLSEQIIDLYAEIDLIS